MAKPTDKRDHQLTVRIPYALRKELDRIAERNSRSIADLVVFALLDYTKRVAKGARS